MINDASATTMTRTHIEVFESRRQWKDEELDKLRHGLMAKMRRIKAQLSIVHVHDQPPATLSRSSPGKTPVSIATP